MPNQQELDSLKTKYQELKEKYKKGYLFKPEAEEILRKAVIGWGLDWKELEGFFEKSKNSIEKALGYHKISKPRPKKEDPKKPEEKKPLALVKSRWPEPEIIDIPKESWEKPGSRTFYLSCGGFEDTGFRKGIQTLGCELAAKEGCHIPVFAGGLISKEWIQKEIKRLNAGVKKDQKQIVINYVLEEAAKGLSSTMPKIRKPDGTLVKWYIMPSEPDDGPYGEKIIHLLENLRQDVRLYKKGGERIEVLRSGQPSLYHGVVLPKKKRMPSKYMSPGPEGDIEDIEGQTGRDFPSLWVQGGYAVAIFKPAGERMVPYVTLPKIQKLEAENKKKAENQSGFTIIEDMPDGDRLIHLWCLRDLIAKETENITGIKEGASELHKKIVDIIKREGARHPGRLAEELGIEREILDKEIQFLVEDRRSPRLTWPGLYYDKTSDRYGFHPDWIRRTLRYGLPKNEGGWCEDSFLFFSCLHGGYTTTDVEFFVTKVPEKILQYNIQILAGVGDFIAGLHHHFLETGEVLYMNNTEQEIFAARIVATAIFKVFRARFENSLSALAPEQRVAEQIERLIRAALLLFIYIRGNHDDWQGQDGSTPLNAFTQKLRELLFSHILKLLANHKLPAIDINSLLDEKVKFLDPQLQIYTLPSGIKVGLDHPYMGRATTSLRAENVLKMYVQQYGCQVVGVGNFHTAVTVHKWWPHYGQCVAVQNGTLALFTSFEARKTKVVDFGVNMLKTLSYNGRIFKTTIASFTDNILKEPIRKNTDPEELAKKLNLLN